MIVRVAFRLTPPAEPVITALVVLATTLVVTGKEALVAFWAIVTLAGTTAAGLLLDSVTTLPPAGAGLVSVAVPVEGVPPTTLAGLRAIEPRVLGGARTVIVAVRVSLKVPVMMTGVSTATGEVVMLKVANPSPAGTVTVAGT